MKREVALAAAVCILGCQGSQSSKVPLIRETANGRDSLSISGIGRFYDTANPIEEARVIPVPNASALIVVWNERSPRGLKTSHYAISLDGQRMSAIRRVDPELKLRLGNFDPLRQPALGSEQSDTGNVYLVQFYTQPLPIYLDQLSQQGAKPYRYFPNNAYLMYVPSEAQGAVANVPYVRWVGRYRWIYRVDESLLPPSGPEPVRVNIEVFERGPEQQGRVARFILDSGGTVDLVKPQSSFMVATVDPSVIQQLAQMDEVMFIDRWTSPEADMDLVRQISGADYVEQVAGLTGEGVRGEVMDVGVRATHDDFAGALIPHGSQAQAGHGTSTTGIVFGKGIDNPRGRGLLPDGQGITALSGALSDRFRETQELVSDPYSAVFQSNSWGNALTTEYTTVSAEMDEILFRTDILVTQSQSNAASRQSRPQAWAKNIVSVGGLVHGHSLDMETHCWCSHASIGPAADGRIKPDLAHFYDNVFTTSGSSDTSYTSTFGGTSAATPITAGHFGLFFQMWHLGLFGNQTSNTVFNSRPHMATAKATMINTARQWTFSGTQHDRTRTHQGWGMVDVRNLYDLRDNLFIVDETDVLRPFDRNSYELVVPEGTPQLKATLVYKDPPGIPASQVHRINDLSLHVTSPSGVEYWGNFGLLGEMWSASDGDEDHLNTVENVFVLGPERGLWTFEVIATEINEDSHLQTPELDADYALVVSGVNRP